MRQKRVALGVPGVSSVTFLQDHICVLHMEVQSEPRGWSGLKPRTGTSLSGTGAATNFFGKRPGKFVPPRGGVGGGGFLVPPNHAMLALMLRQQQPSRDLNSSIQSVYPPPLSILKLWPFPRPPPPIRIHQHLDRRVAWLASHAHRLPRICHEVDPV